MLPPHPTPSETGQVQGEVNASVLDVVDMSFDIDETHFDHRQCSVSKYF